MTSDETVPILRISAWTSAKYEFTRVLTSSLGSTITVSPRDLVDRVAEGPPLAKHHGRSIPTGIREVVVFPRGPAGALLEPRSDESIALQTSQDRIDGALDYRDLVQRPQ